jgi:hypothetical protein
MQNKDEEKSGTGTLTGQDLEAEDVLAGSEPWEPVETKLVVWSFVIAAIALVIGLWLVPTSILH